MGFIEACAASLNDADSLSFKTHPAVVIINRGTALFKGNCFTFKPQPMLLIDLKTETGDASIAGSINR